MEEKQHEHFAIFKPWGYLSQFKYELSNRRNKKCLGELGDFPEGTMAIGRLDEDSEGLLLLTTDGKTSNAIRSSKFEKEYWVQVDGTITQEACDAMISGVEISINGMQYMTKKCHAELMETPELLPPRAKKIRDDRHGPTSWVKVFLREGKFRQVRKMTAKVGYPTLRLIRVRIGDYHLGEMQPGESRKISMNLK